MSTTTTTVRRDGRIVRLDADELVAGDVVVLEAGDRVPADGRLLSAASLEVHESSLTGEAQPVAKSPSAEVDPDAPLGDRVTAVFMNTAVTPRSRRGCPRWWRAAEPSSITATRGK